MPSFARFGELSHYQSGHEYSLLLLPRQFLDQGKKRTVLRKVRSFPPDFQISLLKLRRHTMVARENSSCLMLCTVSNIIACSYDSNLDSRFVC